jgi:hypothetical protein
MMQVSAWHNGKGTYGIDIGEVNRDRYFDRAWKAIQVEIDGEVHDLPLTPGFWVDCPEVRSSIIKDWLGRNGRLPWPKYQPPHFELTPLGGNRFRLTA